MTGSTGGQDWVPSAPAWAQEREWPPVLRLLRGAGQVGCAALAAKEAGCLLRVWGGEWGRDGGVWAMGHRTGTGTHD